MTTKTKFIKFVNLINENLDNKFWAEGYAPSLIGKNKDFTCWEYLTAKQLLKLLNNTNYKILEIGIENDTIKNKLENLVSEYNINNTINKVYFDEKLNLIILFNKINNTNEILINKNEFIINDKIILHINIIRFLIKCQELLTYYN